MPSDDRTRVALDALRGQIESYRWALASALESTRAELASLRAGAGDRVEHAGAALGPFAAGRIDASRFAEVLEAPRVLDRDGQDRLERSVSTLAELLARGDELFVVDVPSGGRLHFAIRNALAEVGRAFGAALVAELVRRDAYRPAQHDGLLRGLLYGQWSRGERRLAPPIIANVDGADLKAGGLAELLDEHQKIVLIARGDTTPAPLARLITPRTFVLQTHDGSGLDRLVACEGPGVAALVTERSARFVHDPAAGSEPWQRLTIHFAPTEPRRWPIGGLSAWQQEEELQHLLTLAKGARPEEPVHAARSTPHAAEPASGSSADRLTAWLLSQAGLG